MNALIFVLFITVMTFVLFLLFKYRCTTVIWAYMGFAGFNVFFVLGGVVITQLLQRFSVGVDGYSLLFFLYNFATAGVLSVFFLPAPLTLKQAYLVFVGVVTAFWFTKIPEWTTWLLLAAMALYDLYAVLTPGGPLKILVELARERDEDLPALVYEARPMRGPRRWGTGTPAGGAAPAGIAMAERPRPMPAVPALFFAFMAEGMRRGSDEEERTSLIDGADGGSRNERRRSSSASGGSLLRWLRGLSGPEAPPGDRSNTQWEANPIAAELGATASPSAPASAPRAANGADDEDDEDAMELPDGIKLGLGDFIFYSVMVGRAAMHDMLTVFATYLAIVSGLGLTLLFLAVSKKALPALPFSIALGIIFYFATRALLEPFVVGFATNLVLV